MDTVRTVSESKRKFYSLHTRPINSIYRRVVEELLVEIHLLSVNGNFRPDPFYYLGVVTVFDRFMAGYSPESDRDSIFASLCQSIEADPQLYRDSATRLLNFAPSLGSEVIKWLEQPSSITGGEEWRDSLSSIANNPNFKYSRLFAIGLYTLLETADPQLVQNQEKRTESLKKLATIFQITDDRIQKDLELYRGNLEKMSQALSAINDIIQADKKRQAQGS